MAAGDSRSIGLQRIFGDTMDSARLVLGDRPRARGRLASMKSGQSSRMQAGHHLPLQG